MQKLEDFHLRWLELAGVEVDHAALPAEVIFSLYRNLLKYGPNGEAVMDAFWLIEGSLAKTNTQEPLRSLFTQDKFFNAIYILGNNVRLENEGSFRECEALPTQKAHQYLSTQIAIVANSLLIRRSLTTGDDLDYGVVFQKGLLLFFWCLSGLAQNVDSISEYVAALDALPHVKENANAYRN